MYILGINAYHADASAAIIKDGELICAVEEERFTRIKHNAGFPIQAVQACLEMAGADPGDVDHFAVSRNPKANLSRKMLFALSRKPGRDIVTDRLRNAGRVRDLPSTIAGALGIKVDRVRKRLHYVEHHPAHLASSFFVSPFDSAAVCAIDGFGDFVSTSFAAGFGNSLKVIDRVFFPHSIGLVYLALTQYLGFLKFGDEYKVMGLAPYGQPAFLSELRKLIRLKPGGSFELDLAYFCHWNGGVTMSWDEGEPVLGSVFTKKLEELLGPARAPEAPVERRHEDIAASLQALYEEVAFHILRGLYDRTKLKSLCLAGGCAMNSVANGKIRRNTEFEDVYVQPASADNGTSLGAAFYVWNQVLGRPREFHMTHGYWGPAVGPNELDAAIAGASRDFEAADCSVTEYRDPTDLCAQTAARIARGEVIGWFQGRMEWGARALGNRSILADPRRADMREIINTKIKFREKFRPFAPSVMEEAVEEYFVDAVPDPFMIQVYPVRPEKREIIPAVTHVDGSGRLQTVSRDTNPLYWLLIKEFQNQTGVPVLLNTSFNENEPIVRTPEEAIDCFMRTRMDALVLGNRIIGHKKAQNSQKENSTVGLKSGLQATETE
ncbi:MAG TPA: carbamoyltransferase [Blastocatellia bacterium]|nr:carbamoyltransferase [Blastocatellia bacterium]